MKTSLLISVLAVIMLVGCPSDQAVRDKSSDEIAQELLKQVPAVEQQEKADVTHPAEQPEWKFDVYTWQPVLRNGQPFQIAVLGKNLQQATSLEIDGEIVKLSPSTDGTRAAGPYPARARENSSIVITVGEERMELPERFSGLKVKGLPIITSMKVYSRNIQAPESIPEVGGKSVEAVIIECAVSGYEQRNAPVTAFIGSLAILNTQIKDERESVTIYIYRTERLEEGAPITIDFGHGLRVMAPSPYTKPVQ